MSRKLTSWSRIHQSSDMTDPELIVSGTLHSFGTGFPARALISPTSTRRRACHLPVKSLDCARSSSWRTTMAFPNTSNGRTRRVHQPAHATPSEEYTIGGLGCTICNWDENAPPAFTDEMREIMEGIFQRREVLCQRSARSRGVITCVRTHCWPATEPSEQLRRSGGRRA